MSDDLAPSAVADDLAPAAMADDLAEHDGALASEPPPPPPPLRPAPAVLDPDALIEARGFLRLATRSLARSQDPRVAWELLAESLAAADRALGPDPLDRPAGPAAPGEPPAPTPTPVVPPADGGDALAAAAAPAAEAPALPPRPALTPASARPAASDDEARAEATALVAYLQSRLFWAATPGVRLDRRTLLRLGGAAAVVALLVGAGVAVESRFNRRRDLTAGRSWESSSSWGGAAKVGQFTRVMSHPFFHTDDEAEPWLEIDLGSTRAVSRVEVDNRSDYGKDRAVPLTLSVATVRGTWRQVAQRDEVFDTWKAALPPGTQARWLRLQVKRRSLFHLDDVRVY